MKSLCRQIEQHHADQRAATYAKSAKFRKIVYAANDHVQRLCFDGASAREIDEALDTLSALTGIAREIKES